MTKDELLKLVTVLQAELEATNRQVEILSDALAAEREACARIAEEPSAATYECTVACGGPAQTFQQRFPKHSQDIAKEIRARGNT